MVLIKNKEGSAIQFTDKEWEDLTSGIPQYRVIGYSKGYVQFTVKVKKLKDPYK